MGLLNRWKRFSQGLWNGWGSKLQSKADQINSWNIPDNIKPAVQKVNNILLSTVTFNWLKKFVEEVCEKFDVDMAKKIVESVVGVLEDED